MSHPVTFKPEEGWATPTPRWNIMGFGRAEAPHLQMRVAATYEGIGLAVAQLDREGFVTIIVTRNP